MIYLICLAILALYLASLPIRIKVKGGADLDAGRGNISFSVFYIPLFRASGLLENRSLTHIDLIVMQQKKKRELHLDVDRKTMAQALELIKKVDLSFLGNLDVKDIFLSIHYGADDALTTTMLLGGVKIVFYSLCSVLKSNQHVAIAEEFVPAYNMRTFKADFHSIFSLSIADIIYGYLVGKVKKLRKARVAKLATAKVRKSYT
ncbi:MAG: hypothetical protein FWE84_05510 [Firmicutes bacterium]|nr:hypothetical protein [Bacillota bacterium]